MNKTWLAAAAFVAIVNFEKQRRHRQTRRRRQNFNGGLRSGVGRGGSRLFGLIIQAANWLILVSDSLRFHAPSAAPATLRAAPGKLAECCEASAPNELLNVFAVLAG